MADAALSNQLVAGWDRARARQVVGVLVSVPIHRDELADFKGANIWTIRNLIPRLEEQGDDDPWAGIDEADQQITDEMRVQLGMR